MVVSQEVKDCIINNAAKGSDFHISLLRDMKKGLTTGQVQAVEFGLQYPNKFEAPKGEIVLWICPHKITEKKYPYGWDKELKETLYNISYRIVARTMNNEQVLISSSKLTEDIIMLSEECGLSTRDAENNMVFSKEYINTDKWFLVVGRWDGFKITHIKSIKGS